MGMRIPSSVMTGNENKYILNINGHNVRKETEEKGELPKTGEEILIEQFKEENSPENSRVSEIYGKFRAGKELTPEELKYLAENSPEIYKDVMEIIRERKAMEMQMKLAKTKQEVSSVRLNKMTNIKATMGNGKQAENQAMKTMARANQMSDAYIKFTATIEYKDKEDERSQALKRREKILEQEELLEELNKKLEDGREKLREPEEDKNDKEDEETEKKKRRRSRDITEAAKVYIDIADYELLRLKIDNLYRENSGYGGNGTNTKAGSSGVDLFL